MSNDRKATLRAVLDQPFVGFTPWILLSVVEGPHRVVLASALACALAILLVTSGAIAGMAPKLLDLTALAFFGALTVMAAVTSAGTQRWLGVWSAEVSNAAIAVITVGSIAAAKPFTLAYARETTEPEYWDSPLFRRINYVISAVWAVVFLLIAIVGYIGDGPLHQPDNVWTNWIIQIALVILAIKFTRWYPDHAATKPDPASAGDSTRTGATLELLRPLAAYLIPAGILVLIISGPQWWIGASLIALGILISKYLGRSDESTTTSNEKRLP